MEAEPEKTKQIRIRCPHCYKENAINLIRDMKCKHCHESLANEKYIKPLISAFMAAIVGFGSGSHIDRFFEKKRYPVKVEYALIESCISASEKPLEIRYFSWKKDVCQEALESTQNVIDYDGYNDDPIKFIAEYEKQCLQIIVRKKNQGSGAK